MPPIRVSGNRPTYRMVRGQKSQGGQARRPARRATLHVQARLNLKPAKTPGLTIPQSLLVRRVRWKVVGCPRSFEELDPITAEPFKRKLTAILSADVKGCSRLMGAEEEPSDSLD